MTHIGSPLSSQISSSPSSGVGGSNTLDPSLVIDFVNGSPLGDGRLTTARSGAGATYFDQTGTLQMATANTQRIDYGPVPTGVTNWIRNSNMVGAISGSPGTAPTNWAAIQSPTGVTSSIAGVGIENGIPYIDITFVGTASTGQGQIIAEANNAIPATNNQAWTHSMYVRAIGTATGLSNVQLSISQRDGIGSLLGDAGSGSLLPTTGPMSTQRIVSTITTNNIATAFVMPRVFVNVIIGAVNFTIRIGGMQLEQGSISNPWVPTSGAVTTVGAVPLGLLIEEGRTNYINNPRAEGAVPGTPGAGPTNWGFISQNVIGLGTENGIPYIDVRFVSGTAALGNANYFQQITDVAASPGQSWTISMYLRLVAGSLSGVTLQPTTRYYSAGSTFISQTLSNNPVPTNVSLSAQRVAYTDVAPTNTVNAQAALRFISSGAYDFTIRIGCPQLELGTFVTSPILPLIGTPVATTRGADLISMPSTGYYIDQNTTVAVSGTTFGSSGSAAGFVLFSDGTDNNRAVLRAIGGFIACAYVASTIVTAQPATGTVATLGLSYRCVMRMGLTLSVASNGGVIASQNSNALGGTPIGITFILLGRNNSGSSYLNGYLRNVYVWTRLLTDPEMTIQSSAAL